MNDDILFNPIKLGDTLELKNRIVMAPMTRSMASDELAPTDAFRARPDVALARPGRSRRDSPGLVGADHRRAARGATQGALDRASSGHAPREPAVAWAISALRSAISKLESFSLCFPTPLVRNILFATNILSRSPWPRTGSPIPAFASSGNPSQDRLEPWNRTVSGGYFTRGPIHVNNIRGRRTADPGLSMKREDLTGLAPAERG